MIDLEACYQQYGAMVFRRCRQLLTSEERARDATQDVFVQILRKGGNYRGTFLSGLLYRIATNVCLNIIRSEKRTQGASESLIESIASHRDFEENYFIRELLDAIFSSERPDTRLIAVYHYLDKMTLAEIAGEMKLSVSGVRKRLKRLEKYEPLWREYHESRV